MVASMYARTLQHNKDKIMKLKANLALAEKNKDYVRSNEIFLELKEINSILFWSKSACKNMIKGKIENEAKQLYLYDNIDIDDKWNFIRKKEFILKKLIDDDKLLLSLSMTEIRNLEDKLGNIYVEWNDE
jgi:hypothetical protein